MDVPCRINRNTELVKIFTDIPFPILVDNFLVKLSILRIIILQIRLPKLATEVSFPSVQRTSQRNRSNIKPDVESGLKRRYKSIWKFAKHMEDHPEDMISKDAEGNKRQLKGKLIRSSSKTYHFFMYDEELMNEFNDGEEIYLDGTFDARPKIDGVGQLLTIMAKKYNVVCY